MPVAGDEGYEKMVICPYDKAHEIRLGRMQFHLDKCRKNFPNTEMIRCPFNSIHLIPKVEQEFHTQEECASRTNWDRSNFDVGDVNCPVKDLVPVNAATVPDGDENWDSFEAPVSVLSVIKDQAANKNIFRNMQCESKAKRKNFRKQEKERHAFLISGGTLEPDDDTASFVTAHSTFSTNQEPLPKPSKPAMVRVERQDPAAAVAALNKQFRTLDLDMKTPSSAATPSDGSSVYNEPPSTAPSISDAASVFQESISYAAASASPRSPTGATPAPSVLSRPSSAISHSSRPSTAMSIAASVNRAKMPPPSADGFCQIPIPGLGRGRRNHP
uniref:CHHC U11-48K-type domain-containing protein n=1 Tax=Cuerna arida TaxID=1464854 RepID=A0A1B6GSR0_9HEMI